MNGNISTITCKYCHLIIIQDIERRYLLKYTNSHYKKHHPDIWKEKQRKRTITNLRSNNLYTQNYLIGFLNQFLMVFRSYPCLCGCGTIVVAPHRYIKGHSLRHNNPMSILEYRKKAGKNSGKSRKGKYYPHMRIGLEAGWNWSKGKTKENNRIIAEKAEKHKLWWASLTVEERSELIKKMYNPPSQNKSELKLELILDKLFPGEYSYVGDGKVWIGYPPKNPDFITKNNKRKIIELYGEYWHDRADEPKRIEYFKKYNFDTLIIWEKEFKNINKLQEKLLMFHIS